MRVIEVEMIDPQGRVVEHGTCLAEIEDLGGLLTVRAHTFRSSARPDDDWQLPPLHSFMWAMPV